MDRGIPTEEVLAEMRNSEPPSCAFYLGWLAARTAHPTSRDLLTKPWEDVRESVQVELIEHEERDICSRSPRPAQQGNRCAGAGEKTDPAAARTATADT